MLIYHLHYVISNSWEVHLEDAAVPKRILYLDTLQQLAKELDKAPLALLIQSHVRMANVSRSRDTTSFQKIALPQDKAFDIVQMLLCTKRLFFQKKPLEGGLHTQATPLWKEEVTGHLTPFLSWKNQFIPLEECALHSKWAIWQQQIFPLDTSIAWKWIDLFSKGPLLLVGAQKKQFFDEEPSILALKKEEALPLTVLPCLELTDATGCFANLWMDYSNGKRLLFDGSSANASWERDLLEAGFARKIVGRSNYYCEGDKARATLQFLLELGWKILSFQGKKIVRQTAVHCTVFPFGDQVKISTTLHFDDKTIVRPNSPRSLWCDLDFESVGLLDVSKWPPLEQGEAVVSLAQLAGIASAFPQTTSWDEQLRKRVEQLPESTPADCFKGTLLPYQQEGVNFLAWLYRSGFSGLLADAMGLGKTVQVLAFFSQVRTNLPLLVVAPSSLLYQWSQEIDRFLPNFPTYIHAGPLRQKDLKSLQGVIITSYAILRQDVDLFKQVAFEVAVLDESNAIKTASSQTFQVACQLQAKCKIALTGTPVENRAEELISQFQFLMPGLLSKKLSLDVLRMYTKPFLLRRLQEDVALELPEKRDIPIWVSMTEEQQALYDAYVEKTEKGLLQQVQTEGFGKHRMEVLEAILRLRQICVDPRLVGGSFSGSKWDLLLDEIGEQKVLVYSQFTSMLKLIAQELKKRDIPLLYLDGDVSLSARAERVAQFQEDPEAKIFLISLKAGGVGLNLTAAEGIILLDPWWNEAIEAQVIARAHRMGQKNSIFVKRYLTPHSIEEKMLRIKEKKQGIAQQVLEGADESLTEEDLLHLLL